MHPPLAASSLLLLSGCLVNGALYEERRAALADRDGDGSPAAEDCDDQDPARFPGQVERCDGIDNDCNNAIDDSASDAPPWFLDADDDGFGAPETATRACTAPERHVSDDTDCDDADAETHPGAPERCDGTDNDCNGAVDDAPVDAATWYLDGDDDGFGATEQSTVACEAPPYHVADPGDCDDGDGDIGPHADEVCNDLVDNDCDGTANGCGWSGTVSVADADARILGAAAGDGFGLVLATGDLDNDGVSDIVSGALHGDAAVVVPGAALASTVYLGASTDRVTKDASLPASYRLAQSIGLCDVTGEGREDLLVSGFDYNRTSELMLFAGPLTGSHTSADADLLLTAESPGDFLGNAFACGDFDGDGVRDVVAAAALADGERGAAYWLPGPLALDGGRLGIDTAAATLSGSAAGEHAGATLTANDLDGDGTLDLTIGATEYSGAFAESGGAYLLLGGLSGDRPLTDADAVLSGESAGARFGVLASGDLDLDGYADLAVGADFESSSARDAGALYVFFGGAAWADAAAADADVILRGEAAGDRLGISVSVAETPATQPARLFVAALFSDRGRVNGGAVYAFPDGVSGPVALEDAEGTFVGEAADDQIGFALQAEDDFNRDGYPDVLIGAYAVDSVGEDAGASYLFYGLGL